MNKNFKPLSIAVIIILVAALLIVNCAAIFVPRLYTELDMSSTGIYDISAETEKLLSKLDKKVDIYILNADGSNLKFERFVKNYASQNDMISVHYEDSADYAAYSLKVECDGHFEVLSSSYLFYYDNTSFGKMSVDDFNYYVETYSANEAYSEYLNKLLYESTLYFQGDYMLSYIIEYVAFGEIPYIICGHGENDVSNGNFVTILNSVNYRFKTFDITKENEIPDNISCFVINEPDEDYSESETKFILDYLKDGGSLVLVTSEKNLEMPNLMSIASYYGLSAEKGFVAEPIESEEEDDSETDTEGETETGTESETESEGDESAEEEIDPYLFVPEINYDHDLMAIFDGYVLVALNANPIVKNDNVNRDSLIVTDLIVSSDKSYVGEDQTKKGSYVLGISVEEITDNGTTQFLWFTGADAFNKEEYIKSNNIALLYYGAVWMENYSELGEISPVLYGESLLSVGNVARLWCGVTMILLIPTAIVGYGVVVCMKRSKNAKKS